MGKYKGLAGTYSYRRKDWANQAARGARKHGCKATVTMEPKYSSQRTSTGRRIYNVRVYNCPSGV